MDRRRPVIVLLKPPEAETWELLVDDSLGFVFPPMFVKFITQGIIKYHICLSEW